jgi:hypothetical protein
MRASTAAAESSATPTAKAPPLKLTVGRVVGMLLGRYFTVMRDEWRALHVCVWRCPPTRHCSVHAVAQQTDIRAHFTHRPRMNCCLHLQFGDRSDPPMDGFIINIQIAHHCWDDVMLTYSHASSQTAPNWSAAGSVGRTARMLASMRSVRTIHPQANLEVDPIESTSL